MGMSSTTVAKPWLLLPTRSTSPLRTYQTVPLTSRSRVLRRPTASTVPVASWKSMTSPTPYWSSSIMNMPDEEVLDDVLRAEAQGDADDGRPGDERREVEAERADDEHEAR